MFVFEQLSASGTVLNLNRGSLATGSNSLTSRALTATVAKAHGDAVFTLPAKDGGSDYRVRARSTTTGRPR